jgi:ribosome production factor 1
LDISTDPFAAYFNLDPNVPPAAPKILLTTSPKPTRVTYAFCEDLVSVFPGAEFVRRKAGKGFELGRIAEWAAGRGFSHMIVVNEDTKKLSALLSWSFTLKAPLYA